MTAPSQTPEAAGLEVVAWMMHQTNGIHSYANITPCADYYVEEGSFTKEPLVTAASAQAAIDAEKAKVAELEVALEEARTIDAGFWKWLGERDLQPDGPDVEWGDIVVALTEHEDNAYDIADKATARAEAEKARVSDLERDRTELARIADEWTTEAHERGNKLIAAEARADRLAKALERAADDLRDIGSQKPQPTNSPDPEHENYLRRTLISLGQVGNARARAALQQETQK